MDFMNLIKKEGYIPMSYELNNKLGLKATSVLTILIQKYLFIKEQGKLSNGKFYCSVKEIERKTGLDQDEQKNIIDKLVNEGFIICQKKGYRYFKIFENEILNLFNDLQDNDDNNLLSEDILNMFNDLFNKNISVLTQKRLLEIIDNETIIKKALLIASEHDPESISYIFTLLKDWKYKNLLSINKIENFYDNPSLRNNIKKDLQYSFKSDEYR